MKIKFTFQLSTRCFKLWSIDFYVRIIHNKNYLYEQEYSETLELFSPTEQDLSISRTFSNISMFFRVRTELYFIAFEWFYMMYLMHLNDFYEFGSIEPNYNIYLILVIMYLALFYLQFVLKETNYKKKDKIL